MSSLLMPLTKHWPPSNNLFNAGLHRADLQHVVRSAMQPGWTDVEWVGHVTQQRHAVVSDGVVELLSVLSSLDVVERGNDLGEGTVAQVEHLVGLGRGATLTYSEEQCFLISVILQ